MLIVGCDIGSETHYIRAIDTRGRELSKGAFEFSNQIKTRAVAGIGFHHVQLLLYLITRVKS